jgi:hypothetical protein
MAMFKLIFLLWRRADFSHQQLVDYYEKAHSVLGASTVPRSLDYRRNYPLWTEAAKSVPNLTALTSLFPYGAFDVMTELWFHNRQGRQAQLDAVQEPKILRTIVEDEKKFMDRGRQIYLAVDEVSTNAPPESWGTATTKLLRFVRKSPDLSSGLFRLMCERQIGALEFPAPGVLSHRRNYVIYDDPMTFAGPHEGHIPVDKSNCTLDLLEEFWCDDSADVAHLSAQALQRDRDLADPAGIVELTVQEHRSDFGEIMAPVTRLRAYAD